MKRTIFYDTLSEENFKFAETLAMTIIFHNCVFVI